MAITFYKMHGLGNDFVVIETITQSVELNTALLRQMANRKTGIGCDQILILKPASNSSCDFLYEIYNSNGNAVGQCANGARCMGLLIETLRLSTKQQWRLSTITTQMTVSAVGNQQFQVDLPAPTFTAASIPMTLEEPSRQQISLNEQYIPFMAVNVGNPHIVIEQNDLSIEQMSEIGRHINQSPQFPEGANVNFITVTDPKNINLNVYERGEGFTLACGSGACASFACARKQQQIDQEVTITQPGGPLKLGERPDQSLYMSGSAKLVFQGGWIA